MKTSHDMPLFVLLNGGSGADRAARRERIIRKVFEDAGQQHEVTVIEDPSNLPSIARDLAQTAAQRGGAVIVAGGDGTINAAVGRVLDTGAVMGVLPQGTFNFTGRNQGIPEALEDAVQALLEAHVSEVQVGAVNDRLFLVNASLGLYPKVLEDREAFKQQLGRSRAVALLSGLVSLLRRRDRFHLDVTCDGEGMQQAACTLVVGNNRLQLEDIGLANADAVDHGSLVGIAVEPIGPLQLLLMAARGMLGMLGDDMHARNFAFTDMRVSTGHQTHVKVALDGEICRLRLPLHFRVEPRPLRMLVPDRVARAHRVGVHDP